MHFSNMYEDLCESVCITVVLRVATNLTGQLLLCKFTATEHDRCN